MASDPGPLARLRGVTGDPSTMGLIAQRVADGEFLHEIARAWGVPYGRLAQWIIEDVTRSEIYALARRFAVGVEADEMRRIADEATPETVMVAKERIRVRQWRASKLDRPTYGELGAAVNVQVNDNRVMLDRDAMVLETARGMMLFLEDAGRIVEPAAAALEEKVEPRAAEPDADLI